MIFQLCMKQKKVGGGEEHAKHSYFTLVISGNKKRKEFLSHLAKSSAMIVKFRSAQTESNLQVEIAQYLALHKKRY